MKIGIYSYVFYPESFLINELSFELTQKGHEISVSTSLPNYESKNLRSGYSLSGPYTEKVNNTVIKRFPIVPRYSGFLFLFLNYLSNLIFGIFNLFRIPKHDVSFVFAVSPILTAIPPIFKKWLWGTPLVIWLQDPWPETFASVVGMSSKNPVYRLLGVVVRWIYSQTDLILIQSEAYRENLATYGYRGRVELIPNWAPTIGEALEKTPDWVQELPENSFLLTFAGNIGKGQSLETLLNASKKLEEHPDFYIIIVGDGTELENLRSKAQKENILNVIFSGRRPLSDMPHLFKKSSCLYVSLSADHLSSLTIPSKLQAYMNSGKPILASLKGEGARIVKESGCGLTVVPGDEIALLDTIRSLLSLDTNQLLGMGRLGKEYYHQHFDKSVVMAKIESLLKEVIK